MILYQGLDRANLPRRDVNKPQFVGSVTDLIVPREDSPAPRPQAFLVEQSPQWLLPPHFHEEHQFQVFVQGNGSLGSHQVQLYDVHYASPYTGYGPLVAGKDGISYLTLRAVGDTGAWYLPESRGRNLRIPKVGAHASPGGQIDIDSRLALSRPDCEELIKPDPSGLAAWMVRLGPQQSIAQPSGSHLGGGRFLVVAQGELHVFGNVLTTPGVVWLASEDELELQAGSEGLAVLVLQFPAQAAQSFIEAHSELQH